jgi:tetratricopeptide (TPR) repeat protein
MRHRKRFLIAAALAILATLLGARLATSPGVRERSMRRASLAELEARARRQPGDLLTLTWLGQKRRAAEQLEGAESAYRQALAVRSSHGPVWVGLAEVLRRRGRHDEAFPIVNAAIAQAPTAADAHACLALLHERRGEIPQALAAAQRAIQLAPEGAAGWHAKGVIHHRMEQAGNALACLRNAARFAPLEARYHQLLGEALRDVGHLEEAESPLARALVLAPNFAETHLSLGQLYAARPPAATYLPRAVRHLQRARDLMPSDWAPRYHLGRVYQRQRRFAEAAAELEAVVELAPDFDPALLDLSRAYAGLGRRDLARQYLASFEMASANYQRTQSTRLRLNHDPENAALHFELARLYLERGRNRAAYTELQAGLARDPENAWARQALRRLTQPARGKTP